MKQIAIIAALSLLVPPSAFAKKWERIDAETMAMASLISENGEAMLTVICDADKQECGWYILSQLKNERGSYHGITVKAEGHPDLKYSGIGQGYMPFWKAYRLEVTRAEGPWFGELFALGDISFEMKVKKNTFSSAKLSFSSEGFNAAVAGMIKW